MATYLKLTGFVTGYSLLIRADDIVAVSTLRSPTTHTVIDMINKADVKVQESVAKVTDLLGKAGHRVV
jgi:hypothetical protein